MATELFNANLASTNVLAGGTDAPPSGTSEMWTVASSAAFGVAVTGVSVFHVADPALNTEVIRVTNVSGNTWTVTRGAENTTPLAHEAGFNVYQVVTTGFLGAVSTAVVSGATSWYNVTSYGATGNGSTDDTAAIQAAMTAAGNAGGGTVYFPPGTYLISSSLPVPSNTIIQGNGRSSILLAAAGAYPSLSGPNLLAVSSVSRVIIQDLAFNGNSANITYNGGYNYLHGGTTVGYTNLQGIYILNSDDVTVQNCYIHDCFSSGIMAQGSTDLIISGNRLTTCGDNQIYVRAYPLSPYTPCGSVTISDNICSGGAFSGIQVLGSSYITVTGNVCYSNGPSAGQGDGIGSEGSSYVTITGNTCYSNGIQGVNVRFTSEVGTNQASSHVVVSSNVIYGHTSSDGDAGGISVSDADDVLVTDNLLYDNYWGINVCTVAMTVTNTDVTDNKVRNASDSGIRITPGTASTFNVTGNKVSGGLTQGIYTNVLTWINGNTIWGNTSFGIHLDTGSSSSQILGNTIYDNGDNGIHLGGSSVATCVIQDNYFTNVTGTQPRGIYEASGNGPTTALGNYIIGQVTTPYYFSNAASLYNTLDNGSGQASFGGSASTGALVTKDVTVQPNLGRSSSASVFLDNTNSQIWEFFNNSGGQFGVYDDTNSVQAMTIAKGMTAGTNLNVQAYNIYAATANFDVSTTGYGIKVAEGSGAKQGIGTLSSGALIVANSNVTSSSRIFLTHQSTSGTPGVLYVSGRTAATSFAVASTSGSDNGVFAYEIFEPG